MPVRHLHRHARLIHDETGGDDLKAGLLVSASTDESQKESPMSTPTFPVRIRTQFEIEQIKVAYDIAQEMATDMPPSQLQLWRTCSAVWQKPTTMTMLGLWRRRSWTHWRPSSDSHDETGRDDLKAGRWVRPSLMSRKYKGETP